MVFLCQLKLVKTMKNYKIQEITNTENIDLGIFCENVPFTQAGFYGDWQKKLGRAVKRFLISCNGETVGYFQIVKYPLLLGRSYFYIPYGPVTKDFSDDFLIYIRQELKRIAKTENAVFVRLDFTPFVPGSTLSRFFTKSLLCTYHSAYFQPRAEWFLALKKPEEKIFSEMDKKTRYSIQLADKREVVVDIITEDFEKYFEDFYELMLGTAERNKFGLHEKDYYKNVFQSLSKANSYLAIARYGDKVLAMDMVIVFEKIASYVFGGSSDEERGRLPTYLVQWKAICYAKQLGCDYFNFGGIATGNKIYKGWEGLTAFKKKFGGQKIVHSDFFDIVVNPFWYWLYNFRKLIKKLI